MNAHSITKVLFLFLYCTVVLGARSEAAPPRVVIWKLDDVKAGEKARLAPGFKRVAAWAKQTKTVVTMGVICESLANPNPEDVAWIRANAIQNGGQIEFWLHGWDHKTTTGTDGLPSFEFKGPDLATQATHFKDACEIFRKTTDLSFRAFGAPNNQIDSNTPGAMDQTPELTIWMYGPKSDSKRTVLHRSLNIEIATGKVSYDKFIESYQAKPPTGPLLLQGHSGMWSDESYADFVKIAEFLAKEGWITQTSAQYVDSLGKSQN